MRSATDAQGRPQTFARSETGQAMIEFVIVVIILMLVILGIVDFARAVYARNAVSFAAREGARFGIAHDPERWDEIATIVQTQIRGASLDMQELGPVVVSQPCESCLQVEVVYTFRPISSLIAGRMGAGAAGSLRLRGRSVMTRE